MSKRVEPSNTITNLPLELLVAMKHQVKARAQRLDCTQALTKYSTGQPNKPVERHWLVREHMFDTLASIAVGLPVPQQSLHRTWRVVVVTLPKFGVQLLEQYPQPQSLARNLVEPFGR